MLSGCRRRFRDTVSRCPADSGGEDGRLVQHVEMVCRTVRIDYRVQDPKGGLGKPSTFNWDIPAGTASPSA